MSLAINPKQIAALLLADGWHDVVERSVDFDAYEFKFPNDPYSVQPKGESVGLTWREVVVDAFGTREMFAPLNAVLAVAYRGVPFGLEAEDDE